MTKQRATPVHGKQDGCAPKRTSVTDITRRSLLKKGAIAAGTILASPFVLPVRAAERELTVSTYGGYFEESFNKFVYPEFTKATGIGLKSVIQPSGPQFLIKLADANKAGVAPMDVCTSSQLDAMRGRKAGIWRPILASRIPNLSNLADLYLAKGEGGIDAVGAMGWYLTLVVNTEQVKSADSWKLLWDPAHPNAWGIVGSGESALFEITARTWFGGNAIMASEDGIRQVVAKMAELKPNVKLWWQSDGTMQTALENGEVSGGTYYHDVAGVMARGGTPVASIFPQEGGLIDFGSWCQLSSSKKSEEAAEFINFMCSPQAQGLIARHIGAVPVAKRELLDLTNDEFNAVSTEITPIQMALESRLVHSDFMMKEFNRMISG